MWQALKKKSGEEKAIYFQPISKKVGMLCKLWIATKYARCFQPMFNWIQHEDTYRLMRCVVFVSIHDLWIRSRSKKVSTGTCLHLVLQSPFLTSLSQYLGTEDTHHSSIESGYLPILAWFTSWVAQWSGVFVVRQVWSACRPVQYLHSLTGSHTPVISARIWLHCLTQISRDGSTLLIQNLLAL